MNRIVSIPRLCFIFLLCFFPAACGEKNHDAADGPFFYQGEDLSGRAVALPAEPKRIISLAPSNTEIVFALGAGDRLVAVTRFCDYPEEAKRIPKIGDLVTLNLEQIVKLDPDLILAGNKIPPETRKILEGMDFPVAVTEATSIDEVYRSIALIGAVTGRREEAAELVSGMIAKVTAIGSTVAGLPRPRCYYIVSFGAYGNWTAGPGSFIHEMIECAGGENVGAELRAPWGLFSLERLVVLDPDLLLAGKFSGPLENLSREPGYRDLSALKYGRVVILDDDLVGRPGPRLVLGLEEIARALHPEAFVQGGAP